MLTNYDNLYDYCSNNIRTENPTVYHIGKKIGNYVLILAVDNKNNKIYKYSNEWLHLLTDYYKIGGCHQQHYDKIITEYRDIIYSRKGEVNKSHQDKDIIPLCTSFSLGTVHGYAGLYCIIDQYIRDKEKYKDHYIVIYINSQKGILEIINGFVECGVLEKDKIIYVLSEIPYLFKSITFLFNRWHMYPSHIGDEHNQFKIDIIQKYLVSSKYNIDPQDERICIIKSSESENLTNNGIVSKSIIDKFCENYDFTFLEPMKMNEIELINRLHNAKVFVTSWGTAYFKNHVYLSDKCEKVYILVIGEDFKNQYHSGYVPKKYRNATIEYLFLKDNNLDMPPGFIK